MSDKFPITLLLTDQHSYNDKRFTDKQTFPQKSALQQKILVAIGQLIHAVCKYELGVIFMDVKQQVGEIFNTNKLIPFQLYVCIHSWTSVRHLR